MVKSLPTTPSVEWQNPTWPCQDCPLAWCQNGPPWGWILRTIWRSAPAPAVWLWLVLMLPSPPWRRLSPMMEHNYYPPSRRWIPKLSSFSSTRNHFAQWWHFSKEILIGPFTNSFWLEKNWVVSFRNLSNSSTFISAQKKPKMFVKLWSRWKWNQKYILRAKLWEKFSREEFYRFKPNSEGNTCVVTPNTSEYQNH